MPIKYFVTRHNGAILWARDAGIRARKITQENFDVSVLNAGDIVMGTLPVHLAGEVLKRGGHYWHLSMEVPLELRGKELTAEQMRRCNARLEEFRVLPRGIRSSARIEVDVPSLASDGGLIQVVIASEQILPNLLPALAMPCSGIHILVSHAASIRRSAALLADIARQHFAGHDDFTVIEHKLPKGTAYAEFLAHFIKARDAVRQSTQGAPLMLNITGGTKSMALAAAEAFAGVASIAYFNAQTNHIECIEPAYCAPYPVSYDALSLRLYLQANRYDICGTPSAAAPDLAEMESRQELTGYLARNAGVLATDSLIRGRVDFSLDGNKWPMQEKNAGRSNAWSSILARMCEIGSEVADRKRSKDAPAPLFVRWTLPKRDQCDSWRDLLKRLKRAGVVEIIDLGLKPKAGADPGSVVIEFRFKSAACARYVGGAWLEEFAALTAHKVAAQAGLDANAIVHTGVRLTARNTPGAADSKAEINEIDVAVYYRGRILIIEAKAGGSSLFTSSQSVLNKLDRLKRSVAAPFGSAWLLCARPLDEEEEDAAVKKVSDLLHRAEFYGIECHGADELSRFHMAIATWLEVPCPRGMAKVPPVWSQNEWLPKRPRPLPVKKRSEQFQGGAMADAFAAVRPNGNAA